MAGKIATRNAYGEALVELAEKYNVELPICQAVYNFLWNGSDAEYEIKALFKRSIKQEF